MMMCLFKRAWTFILRPGCLWGFGVVCFGVVALLVAVVRPNIGTALSVGLLAATLMAILWYTIETRSLRLQQQWDSEIHNHPWLKGSDLDVNQDEPTARFMGIVASETIYLPVKNVGTTPAYALHINVQWEMKGQSPSRQERQVVSGLSLAPGDTCHARLCDLEFLDPGDRATIDLEIEYRSFMGGGGRLKMNFYSHEKGWANGPTSPYEFWLSDGRQFPVATGTSAR